MIKNTGVPLPDDWRRQGQEKYLSNIKLTARNYKPYRIDWEHDHCEFCGSKFSEQYSDIHKGYSSENNYYWICNDCFTDFKKEFNWQIEE